MTCDMGFDLIPVFDEKELKGYQVWLDRIFATLGSNLTSSRDFKITVLHDLRYYHALIQRLRKESDAPCLYEMNIDLCPFRSDSDVKQYHAFLEAVKLEYETDSTVVVSKCEIKFQAGEHPALATDPRYQRRFSSKIKGIRDPIRAYIRKVHEIALRFFPSQVKWWCDHEYGNDCSYWTWSEVLAAKKPIASAKNHPLDEEWSWSDCLNQALESDSDEIFFAKKKKTSSGYDTDGERA